MNAVGEFARILNEIFLEQNYADQLHDGQDILLRDAERDA